MDDELTSRISNRSKIRDTAFSSNGTSAPTDKTARRENMFAQSQNAERSTPLKTTNPTSRSPKTLSFISHPSLPPRPPTSSQSLITLDTPPTSFTLPQPNISITSSTTEPRSPSSITDASSPTSTLPTFPLDLPEHQLSDYATTIRSPLNPQGTRMRMESLPKAEKEKYKFVPIGMERGFVLNIDSRTPPLVSPNTLPPKEKRPEIRFDETEKIAMIDEYLFKERQAGRISPPMSKAEVESIVGAFQVSPFVIVLRPGEDPRLVRDFSWPYPSSHLDFPPLNDRFSDHDPLPPTFWCTARDFAFVVLSCPVGTRGRKDDVIKAFRMAGIFGDDRKWIVMQHQGQFYIDLYLPMGMKVSTEIWGRIVDLVRLCAKSSLAKELEKVNAKLVGIRNWVDDIMALAVLDETNKNQVDELFDKFYADFGLPLSDKKHRDWATIIIFLGMIWNLRTKTVSVSIEKADKGFKRAKALLELVKISLDDLEKVTGYLSHLSFVIEEGRFHLVSLFALQASFDGNRFITKPISDFKFAHDDLLWWISQLNTAPLTCTLSPSALNTPPDLSTIPFVTRSLSSLAITHRTIIKSDASNSHLAFALDSHHTIYPLKRNWRREGDNIDLPEAVALELAVLAIFDQNPSLSHVTLLAYVDNEGVVKAWKARRCRGRKVNNSLQRIYSVLQKHSCQLEVEWIASEDNEADDLTRGVEPRARTTFVAQKWINEQPSKDLLELVDFPKEERKRLK